MSGESDNPSLVTSLALMISSLVGRFWRWARAFGNIQTLKSSYFLTDLSSGLLKIAGALKSSEMSCIREAESRKVDLQLDIVKAMDWACLRIYWLLFDRSEFHLFVSFISNQATIADGIGPDTLQWLMIYSRGWQVTILNCSSANCDSLQCKSFLNWMR